MPTAITYAYTCDTCDESIEPVDVLRATLPTAPGAWPDTVTFREGRLATARIEGVFCSWECLREKVAELERVAA